ncbi:MAG: D-arabinono-1,4-lactone oxidase [Anaerolineales bacterium]
MEEFSCQRNNQWTNWGGNLSATPEFFCTPLSWQDIVTIVNNARNLKKKVRVLGGGYSWTPMVPTNDMMIDMSKLNQIISVDQEKKQVTVEAGMRVGDLSLAIGGQPYDLDQKPFAKPVVAPGNELSLETETVIPWITVGGAVALNCHGTGYNQGTVSDLVVAMDVITADGVKTTYSVATHGEDVMNALKVNLGALGVVYSVTFQCVPQFNLRAIDSKADMQTAIDTIEGLVTKHDYTEVFWFPFNKNCWIKTWDKTDQPVTEQEVKWGWDELKVLLEIKFFGIRMMDILEKLPKFTNVVMNFISWLMPQQTVVAPSSMVFHYQLYYMPVWDMSYCINIPNNDFSNVKKAWNAVTEKINQLAGENQYPQNMVMHTRYIKSSSAYLSPANGEDHTCCIEILTFTGNNRPVSDYENYFKEIEQDWIALGGKPHWGKAIYSVNALKAMYGANMDAFLQIRQTMDPNQMFINDFLKQVFQLP